MQDKLPPGVRLRGKKLYILLKRGTKWGFERTDFGLEQIDEAVRLRNVQQALIDSGQRAEEIGRTKVRTYAARWLDDRRARNLKSVDDDEQRMRDYILNFDLDTGRKLGDLWIDEVRPSHCRAAIRAVVQLGRAPRTILNIASIGKQMFSDAVADELITSTPWVVPRKDVPTKNDADPEWREGAVFTRDEIRTLFSQPFNVIPWDRAMLYLLMYLGALRFGEASALRWVDILKTTPLRSLHIHRSFSTRRRQVGSTKTSGTRKMPVHPALLIALRHWKKNGWPEFFGRAPLPEDLVVPSRRGAYRSKNHMLHHLHEDLAKLGLRIRRQHDLRRSFISHAVDGGARKERLKPATHGLGKTVLDLYDTPAYRVCCKHVMKLRFELPSAEAFANRLPNPLECVKSGNTRGLLVEAPGIELGADTPSIAVPEPTKSTSCAPAEQPENGYERPDPARFGKFGKSTPQRPPPLPSKRPKGWRQVQLNQAATAITAFREGSFDEWADVVADVQRETELQ